MADLHYLKRRKQTWYFRLAVPRDLRGVEGIGKPEIVESLGTRDLSKAQSLRWERRSYWEERFRLMRAKASTAEDVRPRDAYLAQTRELEETGYSIEPRHGMFSDIDIERDAILDEACKRAGVVHEDELEDLSPDDEERLKDLHARLDALNDYEAERAGRRPRHREAYALPVSEAATGYLKEVGKEASKQTVGQYEATLRLFADYLNDKPLAKVTRRDVASFLDEIEEFDPNWGRSPKTKERSFKELKALYHKPDGPGLSNRTVNRYVTAISGMWDWAKKRGEVQGENPASGFFKPITGKHAAPFQPYPPELLSKLFAPPEPKSRVLWELPLVALYSGMRLNEIASLAWENVKDEDDIPYFDIIKAKSEAGVRKVPVHPALSWLLARRQHTGQIWPELKAGGPDGKHSWYFTKQFGTFRKQRGVDGPGLKFHSFRKNAVQCLERARVPQNEAAEIVGHEKAGITYRVYSPEGLTMAQRREIVQKIEYPTLEVPLPLSAVA